MNKIDLLGRVFVLAGLLFAAYLLRRNVGVDPYYSRTDGWETTARVRRKDAPPSIV